MITARVEERSCWRDDELVCAYCSVGAEVDTRALIRAAWRAGKRVALPRCEDDDRVLSWYEVTSFADLASSRSWLLEPVPERCAAVQPASASDAVALVPGLGFDRAGYRLGYGGGYYDRFLQGFSGTSLGLCRAMTLVDDLAALAAREPHDLPVDIVVTDEGAYLR